jgi:signal transduction histidine kinase
VFAEIGMMLLALFALAAAGGMGLVALHYRRRLIAAEKLAGRGAILDATLAVAPVGYFAFATSDGGARCSTRLARVLELGDARSVDFDAILSAVEPADGTRLATAVEGLNRSGSSFTLRVRRMDGALIFEVTGVRSRSSAPGASADLLWFADVTVADKALAGAEAERDAHAMLLDALPLPVWRRGADLSLVYCNLAYARAVGRERDTVLGEGIELPGTALAETSRALARRARENSEAVTESHHVVVAGERRLLELSERPLKASTGGCALDLTATEEVQGQLARHIDAHADVLETLSSAIAIYGPDMRLKFFNSAYARLWRLDESTLSEEPHHNDVMEMMRERRRLPEQPDFPAYKAERLRLYSTLIEPLEELQHLPDGSTLRTTVTPHPFGGVLFTFEDVTDRLALERSYNTLIAVQRETLDNLYEGVAVYGVDGRLKLYNPAFARIWKLSLSLLSAEPHAREVVEKTRAFFDMQEEIWPEFIEHSVTEITETGARDGRQERADGSVVDWAQVPLPDGASLFTFLDVTDSIRVERALRERNEALETTDRLKSEFLANISYELRTPLNAIVGFAEILENKFFGELNERQLEYSRAIVESSQRLLALINDILDLATIEAGYLRLDLAPVDLDALLQAIHTLGHERARSRGIELSLDCPANVGNLMADERRLKQALYNLLSNSLKFTPEGGKVVIAVRHEGSEMLLSVTDTGIGIPLEQQTQVFDKFERGIGQGRQAGAGLGLSLVKSLIELHNGWVELDSAPNSGTRVTCHLPIKQPDEVVLDPASGTTALSPGGNGASAAGP